MLVRHPLVTHRTIGLIHWHALRLWRRGAPLPPPRRGRLADERVASAVDGRLPARLAEPDAGRAIAPGGSASAGGRRELRVGRLTVDPAGRRLGGRSATRGVRARTREIRDPRSTRRSAACSSAARPAPARRTWTACGRARTSPACCAWPRSTATRSRSRPAGGASRPSSVGRSPTGRGATRSASAQRNIAAHYDLGNDFYRLFLDETMTYSSAVFDAPDQSARGGPAQQVPADGRAAPACSRGEHVLEIGTGWGGFALYAAGELGCRVTTITISQEQHELATERVRAAGLRGPRRRPAARLPRHRRARTTRSSRSRCSRPSAPSTSRRTSRPVDRALGRAAG